MTIVYATLADMQARFRADDLVQLSDWDDTGALDAARIATAINKAGTIIDGYVAAKYGDRSDLPVPPLLTEIACDIAYRQLHRAGVPDEVMKRHDAAIAMLRDIATGKIRIDAGDIGAVPARPGAILRRGADRQFGRDQLGNY